MGAPGCAAGRAWAAVLASAPVGGLGAALPEAGLAWRQGAGLVEVHVRGWGGGSNGGSTCRPTVSLTPTTLSISWESSDCAGDGGAAAVPPPIGGTLAHRIIPSDCAWTLCDGVLTVSLAKAAPRRRRRGGGGRGEDDDPSFWRALFADGGGGPTPPVALPLGPVPAAYAALPGEDDGVPVALPPLPAA